MMCNEQAYSLAVEKLLNIRPPPRAQWIRGTPSLSRARLSVQIPLSRGRLSAWVLGPFLVLPSLQCCLGKSHGC